MKEIDLQASFGFSISTTMHLSGRAVLKAPFRGGFVPAASVDFDLDGRRCLVDVNQVDVPDNVIELLLSTPNHCDKDTFPAELHQLFEDVRVSAEVVMDAWKFIVARDEGIPEGALAGMNFHWRLSVPDAEWRPVPQWSSSSFKIGSVLALRQEPAAWLQEVLADGVRPLVGLTYLHRAKAEPNPRYRWVDATIAAELCIKEILMAAKPDSEVLLRHLPSPPLAKLYGEVLEKFLGQKSPYLSQLRKGAERRNDLVHKPDSTIISENDALNYVRDVERAIFHAWRLLHPGKEYLSERDLYRPS